MRPEPWDKAPAPEQQVKRLLIRIRDGEQPPIKVHLAELSVEDLEILTDSQKRAFWLNTYNVAVQYLLRTRSDNPQDVAFFDATLKVDDTKISLNDIEHGILRKRQTAGLEYNPIAPTRILTRLEVEQLDPRIHFALNCGARSCPVIIIYESPQLDNQLDEAAERYLATEATYDAEENIVLVPEVFDWFEGDFGGQTGVIEFLQTYGPVPDDAKPDIKYRGWDWKTVPRKFQ